MFIRKTITHGNINGGQYFTYRLVSSERVGNKVRQKTLLNLGRHFNLPQQEWPTLCCSIERHISGQGALVEPSAEIERLASLYAARLIVAAPVVGGISEESPDYQEVDVGSLELTRPRSVGVEHVGLSAMSWLGFEDILSSAGMNGIQRAVAIGSIIGRMAEPGSEYATWQWLKDRSALGELLDIDFETIPLVRMYRASDQLLRHKEEIEQQIFRRIENIFSIETTVTLYDLTNTYFEGEASGNNKAKHGHSKEKRRDCPLVTLGLILDGSGFIRRSRMFSGSVVEATTLEGMLSDLGAPQGALVIMDRGIATEDNIVWLKEQGYRYLVISRQFKRQFDETQAVDVLSASEDTIKIQRVMSKDEQEVRLYCYSPARAKKEMAITNRFAIRFETELAKLIAGLTKPRGTKRVDKILERIGRLKEKSHGIAQHYQIELIKDETGQKVTALTWTKEPKAGTLMSDPGVYCLRSNETSWDEAKLWHTYTMLTDLEAVFRSLKSELGLRPVFHSKEDRTEGHLFITVLAYQFVQAIRRKLKQPEVGALSSRSRLGWKSLRNILSVQRRVTATFRQRDGRVLHVRKSTKAEKELGAIYESLGVTSTPGGVKKLIV